jgi:hypothetical protein
MSVDSTGPGDAERQRAERRAEIVAELSAAHRARVPDMEDEDFQGMIERMAEHQLIYEDFGSEPQ